MPDQGGNWTRRKFLHMVGVAGGSAAVYETMVALGMLRTPREYTEIELTGLIATVGHLAYHVGAIRQIERATRGPLASESP